MLAGFRLDLDQADTQKTGVVGQSASCQYGEPFCVVYPLYEILYVMSHGDFQLGKWGVPPIFIIYFERWDFP